MIFNAAAKAQLLALVEDLEPTPDVNPLQAQLDAANSQISNLNLQVGVLEGQLRAANDKLAAARVAAAATVDALA
ncbi:MAG: hypothetical protein RLZZ182_1322 [Pseudomonadota bacterium]|jgi:hypothetical protein